jgi:hypothetical protein
MPYGQPTPGQPNTRPGIGHQQDRFCFIVTENLPYEWPIPGWPFRPAGDWPRAKSIEEGHDRALGYLTEITWTPVPPMKYGPGKMG